MGDKGCNIRKIVGQEIANQANDIANEDDPAKPTWKNVCPDRHYAKEERANDRQWPNQEQEVRDMERGYEASDASFVTRQDKNEGRLLVSGYLSPILPFPCEDA